MAGFRETLRGLRFVEVQTPKMVASATEGGANVFAIDYFGRPAYLAQSPQFYKQTMVGVFERVFEVGPVFRAEPHDTPRHLNEYVSLDVEMGFIRDHTTVMAVLTESTSRYGQSTLDEEAGDALSLLGVDATGGAGRDSAHPLRGGAELLRDEERRRPAWRTRPGARPRALARRMGEAGVRRATTSSSSATRWSSGLSLQPKPEQPESSNSFDLLFRGLELVTGGQRLHRYEDYLTALAARGLDPEPFAGHLEAFKFGMPPHGGFAIGLERWVARLVGAENLRETTLFPRDLTRLTP